MALVRKLMNRTMAGFALTAAAAGLVAGCGKTGSPGASSSSAQPSNKLQTAKAAYTGSAACRECHPRFYQLWSTSFHGLALQPYTPELGKKLTPQTNDIVAGTYHFRADLEKGVVTERTATATNEYPIKQATGGKNVYYFLTELNRGWLQTLPTAYDVQRKEWFDTTASAVRHFGDRQDEALYWKERPLTFNSSCYSCHVSQLEKNYDLASDSYHTTWGEAGINCETCHGPGEEHIKLFRSWPTNQPPPFDLKLIVTTRLSTSQRSDMCAPCHAKMSPITASFAPGERYFDHFDLVTLENPDFYPDGRDLGENYTFTQWKMNPCAASGKLDCVHCHTSSGRYRFKDPIRANDACMPCHEERVKNATAHTFHPEGSEGNKCISCHMPMTEFARMRRSDHTMRPPAPAATLRFGSPNACNLCHTNQTAEWADQKVRSWRTRDYQKRILDTADLIQAARKHQWQRLPEILSFLKDDSAEVPAVSLVRLLVQCDDISKWEVLRRLSTRHTSPLVRAAAAESLSTKLDADAIDVLCRAVSDDFRLVRVRAASALAGVAEESLPPAARPQVRLATREFVQSLLSVPDDMAAHYNYGNYFLNRGEMQKAVEEFQVAIKLQPGALPPYANAALAYNALGQNEKAEASLRKAISIEPTNATVHVNLGMLLAELQNKTEAEQEFRAALKFDPSQAQAAYNLGLLIYDRDQDEAMEMIQKAVSLRPAEDRYVYALALFQQRAGQTQDAIASLEDLINREAAQAASYALLSRIYEESGNRAGAMEVYRKAAANPKLPAEAREAFQRLASGE